MRIDREVHSAVCVPPGGVGVGDLLAASVARKTLMRVDEKNMLGR